MGNREVKAKLRIQVFNNIERFGWSLSKRLETTNIKENYRYIFEIPDHIPDSQMIRWMNKKSV